MANPRPTCFTVGNCGSRDELQRGVRALRTLGHNWTAISRELGISPRTAKRLHDETETAIREAREAAYRAAENVRHEMDRLDNLPSSLPAAAKIYLALAIFLLLAFAAVAAFTRG